MDFNTIMGAAGTIVSIAAGAFGLLKWVGKYKSNLVKAQDALYAVKAGADGLLSILAEVIVDRERHPRRHPQRPEALGRRAGAGSDPGNCRRSCSRPLCLMDKFLTQLISALVKALLSPDVLPGLLALRRAMTTPQVVEPSKPNSDDDNFLRAAQADGWNLPLPASTQQLHDR